MEAKQKDDWNLDYQEWNLDFTEWDFEFHDWNFILEWDYEFNEWDKVFFPSWEKDCFVPHKKGSK